MKRTDPKRVGDVIADFMREEHLDNQLDEYRASMMWPQIVGQGINRYTISRDVRQGVMYVRLSSAALRQELMMCRSQLVQRINDQLGRKVLTDIVFQ